VVLQRLPKEPGRHCTEGMHSAPAASNRSGPIVPYIDFAVGSEAWEHDTGKPPRHHSYLTATNAAGSTDPKKSARNSASAFVDCRFASWSNFVMRACMKRRPPDNHVLALMENVEKAWKKSGGEIVAEDRRTALTVLDERLIDALTLQGGYTDYFQQDSESVFQNQCGPQSQV
jgi:hypothetical protein